MADIRAMRPGEEPAVVEMLAEAFLDGPVADWLIPQRNTRLEVYRNYFTIFVDYVGRDGVVHVSEDLASAALWLDITSGEPPEIESYDRRMEQACGRWTPRFLMLSDTFAKFHPNPHHTPHWYLMFIGVHPDKQRKGAGSALLDYGHEAWAGSACYLEASNMLNRSLYERHHYKPMTTRGIDLPNGGPPVWPMWRSPQ